MFKFDESDEPVLPASVDDIYQHCNHYDLFRYYIGDFIIGRQMLSPLRQEKKPSFAIFTKEGKILFNDFILGGGDIIRFVQLKFNLRFPEAIAKIVHDSGLGKKFQSDCTYTPQPLIAYNKVIEDTKPIIKIKRRKWTAQDVKFWAGFKINEETLQRYRVYPLQYVFFNNKIFKTGAYAYCFVELKDGTESYTIYQPYSKNMKWYKSHDASVFYGWSQLPNGGEDLLITKSMKDVMCIASNTKMPTVALQSEKAKPKEQVIAELKRRFKNIYVLYDNDYDKQYLDPPKPNWGRQLGKELCDLYGLIQVEIPDMVAEPYKAKDFSDLAKNGGLKLGITMVENITEFKI